jgi:hypothetical protein
VSDTTQPARYALRHLQRWKLGTPYTTVATDLARLVKTPPLKWPTVAIDQTGVGRPVVEMIRQARPAAKIVPVVITGGQTVTFEDGAYHVPKKDLVGALQVLLQSRRLQVARDLPEAATLVKELQAFRVKITAAANEVLEALREKDHDDMVLAVALACWYAERAHRPTMRPRIVSGMSSLPTSPVPRLVF